MIAGSAGVGLPFPRHLLGDDVVAAARALLGAILVRAPDRPGDQVRTGRIVEVEAYRGADDRASHARMGQTARNAPMFGPPGHAYLYRVYGMHTCLNVVAGPDGAPAAILIRAVEPLEGIAAMRADRASGRAPAVPPPNHRLASGPGLVCAAFGIDVSAGGLDLCQDASRLHLLTGVAPASITAGPRIGIAYAGEPAVSVPWRLGDAGSRSLSRRIP